MAIVNVNGVVLSGLVACVPKNIEKNFENILFNSLEDANKFIETTGVIERRIAKSDICTSDLTIAAAEELMMKLNWNKSEVGLLICITQTPDFHGPMNASIIQDKLGLTKECISFDIPIGCSGFVYGTSVLSSMMRSFGISKGLLLVGDTLSKQASPKDKSTQPLFGDAAAAIAYTLTNDENDEFVFDLGGDGSGYKSLYLKDGGYRNPFNKNSLEYIVSEDDGLERNGCHTIMEGMNVFSFGITTVPKTVKRVLEKTDLKVEDVDFFVLHQANFFMNEMIRKKLKADIKQVPYSLNKFGNTSSATIPLTMVSELKSELEAKELDLLVCGFGIGLSWGTLHLKTNKLSCVELIEI
jgi:3-oxoacyl-[acyl-carrier-protein] synthase-3